LLLSLYIYISFTVHKIVQRHIYGVVRYIIITLLQTAWPGNRQLNNRSRGRCLDDRLKQSTE